MIATIHSFPPPLAEKFFIVIIVSGAHEVGQDVIIEQYFVQKIICQIASALYFSMSLCYTRLKVQQKEGADCEKWRSGGGNHQTAEGIIP
jgi:hypothetical protein